MTGGKIGEQLRTGLTCQVSTSSPCSQWHIVTLAESSVTQRGTGPRNWTTGWRVAVYKSKATQVKRSTAFPSKFCSVNHQLPFVHHSDSCGREDELSHLGTLVSSPPTWKISITSDRSVSPLGSISPTSSFCHPGWGRGPTACHPSTSRLRLPAGARALPRRHDSGSHGPNHLRFCQSMACDRMLPFLFEADSLASPLAFCRWVCFVSRTLDLEADVGVVVPWCSDQLLLGFQVFAVPAQLCSDVVEIDF